MPLTYQFRLGGAKGMVVQDPRLSFFRPSFKHPIPLSRCRSDSDVSEPTADRAHGILGSSKERILELQNRSIQEAQLVRFAFMDVSKVLQWHGLVVSRFTCSET